MQRAFFRSGQNRTTNRAARLIGEGVIMRTLLTVLDCLPLFACLTTEPEGMVAWINAFGADRIGRPREELIGTPVTDIWPRTIWQLFPHTHPQTCFTELLGTGRMWQTTVVRLEDLGGTLIVSQDMGTPAELAAIRAVGHRLFDDPFSVCAALGLAIDLPSISPRPRAMQTKRTVVAAAAPTPDAPSAIPGQSRAGKPVRHTGGRGEAGRLRPGGEPGGPPDG